MENRTEEVIHYILQKIQSGEYQAGDCIQSQSILTRKLNCSRTTVERAMKRLIRSGVLEGKRGSGTFVRNPVGLSNSSVNEVVVIAGQLDHLQRSSFSAMFIGMDSNGLPVRWLTAEQAYSNIAELYKNKPAVIAYMPDPPMLMLLNKLQSLNIPILLINRTYAGFDYVTTDTESSLRAGISWLQGKAGAGANAALVSAIPDQMRPYIAERIIAAYEICMELNFTIQPEHIIKRDFEREGKVAYEFIADTLFRRSRKNLAIIVPNCELAEKCMEIAHQCNKQSGKDFFLLTFDSIRSEHGTYGTGVMVQQHAMFRPRIEQWLRQIISGDCSFFAAKIKTRLYTA